MKSLMTTAVVAIGAVLGAGLYTDMTVKQGIAALGERVGVEVPGMTGASEPMEAPDPAAAEAEILAVEQARGAAFVAGDGEAWGQYIADDCVWTSDAGAIASNKAETMAAITERGEIEDTATISEQEVHVYGDAAVATNLFSAANADDDTISSIRRTRTYVKQDGQWRMVALHSSVVVEAEEE